VQVEPRRREAFERLVQEIEHQQIGLSRRPDQLPQQGHLLLLRPLQARKTDLQLALDVLQPQQGAREAPVLVPGALPAGLRRTEEDIEAGRLRIRVERQATRRRQQRDEQEVPEAAQKDVPVGGDRCRHADPFVDAYTDRLADLLRDRCRKERRLVGLL
jgi:hypothetical protein